MKKRYKIVNKTRFFTFITSLIAILLIIVSSFLIKSKAYSSFDQIKYYEVRVRTGDTLWDIASRNLPEKMDVRKMVYKLEMFNEMESAHIYPGDIIKIPLLDR